MNASLLAVLLSALLTGYWFLGRRRPRPFLRSTDTEAVAALNRAQIERLQEDDPLRPPQTREKAQAEVESPPDRPPVAALLDDAVGAPARACAEALADPETAVGDVKAVQHDTAAGDAPTVDDAPVAHNATAIGDATAAHDTPAAHDAPAGDAPAALEVAPVPEASASSSPTAGPSPIAAIPDEAVAAVALEPSQGGAGATASLASPGTASGAVAVATTITEGADAPPLPPAALARPSALPRPEGPSLSAVQQRQQILARLNRWARGSRGQRLQAMALAGQLNHRCALPLLRRGLRDPDPAVMAAAAAAIARFRGRPSRAALAAVVPPASGLGRARLRRVGP